MTEMWKKGDEMGARKWDTKETNEKQETQNGGVAGYMGEERTTTGCCERPSAGPRSEGMEAKSTQIRQQSKTLKYQLVADPLLTHPIAPVHPFTICTADKQNGRPGMHDPLWLLHDSR